MTRSFDPTHGKVMGNLERKTFNSSLNKERVLYASLFS